MDLDPEYELQPPIKGKLCQLLCSVLFAASSDVTQWLGCIVGKVGDMFFL